MYIELLQTRESRNIYTIKKSISNCHSKNAQNLQTFLHILCISREVNVLTGNIL